MSFPIKFSILSYPRTGSTLLVKSLNSLSSVICQSEIFHKDFNTFKRAFIDKSIIQNRLKSRFGQLFLNEDKVYKKLFQQKEKNYKSFLDSVAIGDQQYFGFKIFPGQNDLALDHFLNDSSIKKIILERRNRLRSYVSQCISIETGKWDRYKWEKPSLVQVEINIHSFLQYKKKIDDNITNVELTLDSTNQAYLKLSYEEIAHEFPFSIIGSFLGVEIGENGRGLKEINQEKQNPFSLKEMIANYEEVQEELIKMNLQDYLQD